VVEGVFLLVKVVQEVVVGGWLCERWERVFWMLGQGVRLRKSHQRRDAVKDHKNCLREGESQLTLGRRLIWISERVSDV
jgi:hypothetical protein